MAGEFRDEHFPNCERVFFWYPQDCEIDPYFKSGHRGHRSVRGTQIKVFKGSWAQAVKDAGVPGLLFHDLRRSAVRNMVQKMKVGEKGRKRSRPSRSLFPLAVEFDARERSHVSVNLMPVDDPLLGAEWLDIKGSHLGKVADLLITAPHICGSLRDGEIPSSVAGEQWLQFGQHCGRYVRLQLVEHPNSLS